METLATSERIRELEKQVEALQRFKSWTHKYLDDRGVPHHPPGTHGAAGCRIGDRMDWLMTKMGTMDKECAESAADRVALRVLANKEIVRLKAQVEDLTRERDVLKAENERLLELPAVKEA